jgi:uncharacterized protein
MKQIEVAYALPDQQALLAVEVPAGCTVEQAIILSGILQHFPSIDLKRNKVGIFGQLVNLQHQVQTGDRIEIYRPLAMDPKQARRMRG